MTTIITEQRIKEFKESLYAEEKSKLTVDKYIRDIKAFLLYSNAQISRSAVLEYKERLINEYSVSSANSMLAAINKFLKFCGLAELCVKQFKIQKKAFVSADKELTREEYNRLVCAAERKNNERIALVIQTICSTGIRVSELCYITVEAAKSGEAVVSCKAKTRNIFIVSALRKKLLRYAKENNIKSGAIFITKGGIPMNRSNVWREMKKLCRDAGVSDRKVFPHNLRHLFARTFYGIDKDIAKLADILGHSSINTTRIYIITTSEEHKKRMEHMHLIV